MTHRLFITLILALAALAAKAQDDFNPALPAEPDASYKVTVRVSPEAAGRASGAGIFRNGETTRISTTSNIDYTFSHWTLDGERYSDERAFNFTVGTADAEFVAVYEYTPVDPDDISSVVSLVASPSDACSFNRASTGRYSEDNWIYLNFYPNSGFVFLGWYKGDELISTTPGFNYLVEHDDATLTAKFEFQPVIPGDPGSTGQEDVANSASPDINDDGEVDVQDVVACINLVLSGSTNPRNDISGDGSVDVQDVVALINIILQNN